jgi:ribosomal protein S18 acetylase RimI-like enzyme
MAAGTTIERVNQSLSVRRAHDGDASKLAGLGIALSPERVTVVAETARALAGAVSVAARPFESEMLEQKVASVEAIATAANDGSQIAPLLSGALEVLSADGCSLVMCRRPESDEAAIAALQTTGFQILERLLTLARPLTAAIEMPANVSLASRDDAEACAAIAREAFSFDRFHADSRIADAAADRLKAQWARNSVQGRADTVFVSREGGKVTGFNACLRSGDHAVIDLIGVSASHRGQGLGRALTIASIAHYTGKVSTMRVGTQANNAPSLALYATSGFRVVSSAVTLHAHLS